MLKQLLIPILLAFSAQSLAFAQSSAPPLPPNEMGQIMIFMYHQLREHEIDYVRSKEHFRKDLEDLYQRGYRLANLNDIIDGKITTEKGRTPVVFTFDDAAFGQIDKIQVNGEEVWNPDCAVGIILDFAKTHPDMGIAGTFYVNPFGAHNDRSKSARWASWMQEMVKLGFEFGNHTVNHPNFKQTALTQEAVEKEIGGLQAWIHQSLPGYDVRSMAMPFGIYPSNPEWAADGVYKNETYHHDILLKVGAEPAPSPFSKQWKPLHIPRVRAQDDPGDLPVSGYWIRYFDQYPQRRFVSDGNPNTLTISHAAVPRLVEPLPQGMRVILQ